MVQVGGMRRTLVALLVSLTESYLLRYESSTLILYKELSSPIFQSLSVSPSVRHS